MFTDNVTAAEYVNSQHIANLACIPIIQRMADVGLQFDVTVNCVYLGSRKNFLADPISRFHEPGQIQRFVALWQQYGASTPHGYWLLQHMSPHSLIFLSPQLNKWIQLYGSWINRWPTGEPMPLRGLQRWHIGHT